MSVHQIMITERRKSRRFPGRLAIVSSDSDGLNFSFVADLSREGAYIETERLLPVGSQLTFVLSNHVMEAPVTSEVVRLRDAFFQGGRSGLGVHFRGLDGVAKLVRDDLLLYLMNLQFQQM